MGETVTEDQAYQPGKHVEKRNPDIRNMYQYMYYFFSFFKIHER